MDRFAGDDTRRFIVEYAWLLSLGGAVDRIDRDRRADVVYYHTAVSVGEMSFLLAKPFMRVILFYDELSNALDDRGMSILEKTRVYLKAANYLMNIDRERGAEAVPIFKKFFSIIEKTEEDNKANARQMAIEFDIERESLLRSLWEDEEVIVPDNEKAAFFKDCGRLIDRLISAD